MKETRRLGAAVWKTSFRFAAENKRKRRDQHTGEGLGDGHTDLGRGRIDD